jgi:hypothetical protein
MNVVLTGGLYFLFVFHASQRDVIREAMDY